MTIQYGGNDIYTLMFGTRTLILPKSEIDEIVDEFIDKHEKFEEVEDKLEDKLEDVRDEVKTLALTIEKSFEELNLFIDDDVFDEESFNARRDEIYRLLTKLQKI